MKIVLVGILKIMFLSFVSSDSGVPCRYCIFHGAAFQTSFKLSTSDLPKRCEAVSYGYYLFDSTDADDGKMFKEDEITIQSIVANKLPVFIHVGYEYDALWDDEIFCPSSPTIYDQQISPLIKKINDLKISGIILAIGDTSIGNDYAKKITEFASKMKKEIPSFKIGLSLLAVSIDENTSSNALFNFSVTNTMIDFYEVEMYTTYTINCTPELAASGTLITSPDPSTDTYESLGNAVSQSTMDKNKTYARAHVAPKMGGNSNTYSEYCNAGAEASGACADNTTTLHDVGASVKKHFHGIAVAWPQYDDIDSLCGCQPFPATNTIFDGFDGIALTPCAKMDKRQ